MDKYPTHGLNGNLARWRQTAKFLEIQRGKCAICQDILDNKKTALDHCHATGRLRGLLCRRCNTGLGQFRDNPLFLQAAIEYLRK